jgi:hypothetical protein
MNCDAHWQVTGDSLPCPLLQARFCAPCVCVWFVELGFELHLPIGECVGLLLLAQASDNSLAILCRQFSIF